MQRTPVDSRVFRASIVTSLVWSASLLILALSGIGRGVAPTLAWCGGAAIASAVLIGVGLSIANPSTRRRHRRFFEVGFSSVFFLSALWVTFDWFSGAEQWPYQNVLEAATLVLAFSIALVLERFILRRATSGLGGPDVDEPTSPSRDRNS